MKNLLVALFSLMFLASSCVMYHPQTVDLPLLQHRGDLRADFSVAVSPLFVAPTVDFNGSLAYGITDHIGSQLYASIADAQNGYLQFAAGGFQSLSDYAVVEGYLGYGHGWSHYTYTPLDQNLLGTASGSCQLYYAQTNIGWVGLLADVLDFGVGLKGGLFKPNFSNVQHDAKGQVVSTTAAVKGRTLFEPQLMLRLGGEHVKLRIGMAFTLFPAKPIDSYEFNFSPLTLSLGINYRL